MSIRQAITDPVRYGFAVGRVRVLEHRMLPAATYERLLDAPDFAEQVRVLADTPYGAFLTVDATVDDVERAAERVLEALIGMLAGANLPGAVERFVRLPYDFANLRIRLSGDRLGMPTGGSYAGLGTVPVAVFEGPPQLFPAPFRGLHAALVNRAGPGTDERVAAAIDSALFSSLAEEAREARSAFLEDLVRLKIDVANVRVLLRSRARARLHSETKGLLLGGGSFEPDVLMRLYALGSADIASALAARPGPFHGLRAETLVDLARYDVLADDLVVRHLWKARVVAVGPEPVIGYVMARQAEAMMVRTLLIGGLAGVDRGALRDRVRLRYESRADRWAE